MLLKIMNTMLQYVNVDAIEIIKQVFKNSYNL